MGRFRVGVAQEEVRVTLGQAPLHVEPVHVTLVGVPNGATIERSQAAQPCQKARAAPPRTEGRELQIELRHSRTSVRSVSVGPVSTLWRS